MANDRTIIKGVEPDMTEAGFVAELAGAKSPATGVGAAVYRYAVKRGLLPSALLGIFREESQYGTDKNAICVGGGGVPEPTYSWGNTTENDGKPSYGGTGRVVRERFSVYDGWYRGGTSTIDRLVDYAPYVPLRTVREVITQWAPPNDNNRTEAYIAGVAATITRLGQGGTMNPQERTDAMIAALRASGFEVIDVRGKLPVNPNPNNRYGLVRGGLGGVTKVIQHWTGDSFGRATVKQVTGTDYGVDRISEAMSVDDELDMLRWYANYHISKDGGSWGGIAYDTLFFPSGRIYVAWNIGTLTYHAFSVNGYSYALCCPNANGQALTPRQLAAMNRTWVYLFEETPEIPAAWGDLWGHSEASRFDAQNQTSCPGPEILRHVQQARATGKPTVAVTVSSNTAGTIAEGIGKTPVTSAGEVANPSALRLDVPGLGERWIIEPILSTWREAGGVFDNPNAPGYPRTGMYADPADPTRLVQWFDRARIEVKGDQVSFGLVGLESAQAAGKAA